VSDAPGQAGGKRFDNSRKTFLFGQKTCGLGRVDEDKRLF